MENEYTNKKQWGKIENQTPSIGKEIPRGGK